VEISNYGDMIGNAFTFYYSNCDSIPDGLLSNISLAKEHLDIITQSVPGSEIFKNAVSGLSIINDNIRRLTGKE